MSEFAALQVQLYALYGQGAYSDALQLIEGAEERFPGEASDVYYWRACLTGRSGDGAAALAALRTAEAAGYFYSEQLARDPDLEVLWADPEFLQLMDVFAVRRQAAQAAARPILHTWAPEGSPRGLLAALHGNGGRVTVESLHWRQGVELGWAVAMPQSSQVLMTGLYSWNDLDLGEREVQSHLTALEPQGPVVLGGFSRGGGLAIRMALAGHAPAFFAVAPAFQLEDMLPRVAACQPGQVRGYIVVGDNDFVYQRSLEFAAALEERGCACTVEVLPGHGHWYPDPFSGHLERGLAQVSR